MLGYFFLFFLFCSIFLIQNNNLFYYTSYNDKANYIEFQNKVPNTSQEWKTLYVLKKNNVIAKGKSILNSLRANRFLIFEILFKKWVNPVNLQNPNPLFPFLNDSNQLKVNIILPDFNL